MYARLLIVFPLLVALAYGLYLAAQIGVSHLFYSKAQEEMYYWGFDNRNPSRGQVSRVQQTIDRALRYRPNNPDYLSLKAHSFAWLDYLDSTPRASGEPLDSAVVLQQAGLRVRPRHLDGIARLNEYYERQRVRHLQK